MLAISELGLLSGLNVRVLRYSSGFKKNLIKKIGQLFFFPAAKCHMLLFASPSSPLILQIEKGKLDFFLFGQNTAGIYIP